MNSLAITLVLFSTFMHAGWNLLARHQRSEAPFFLKMLGVIAVVGALPTGVSEALTHSLNVKAWLCVSGSGFFCGLYFFCLSRAYQSSDFTTVYPVARALPVFLVGIGDLLRERYPTELGWIGMLLVISGCFLAPLHSFSSFNIRYYFNRTTLWMLLTALCTVGYTMLDKVASEVILKGPATAARYGYIYLFIAYVIFSAFSRIFYKAGQSRNYIGWKVPILAAGLTFGAYWLVLWAYQLTQHASYIVAFRQFSIVIGVILAFAVYKEHGLIVRLTGTFIITLGLLFIGFWG